MIESILTRTRLPFRSALVFIAALAGTAVEGQSTVAFTHVAVVDARSSTPRQDQTVIVRGNRIVAVGPARTTSLPANARIIDRTGKFLIPGLWDMHVHTAII